MTTQTEALKQLLEALDKELPHNMKHIAAGQRFNARTALAQPEQEPVAWANRVVGGRKWLSIHASKGASDRWLEYRIKEQAQSEEYEQIALYTTPPQRTWVGLTDTEKYALSNDVAQRGVPVFESICEAEAKLKEKNCL